MFTLSCCFIVKDEEKVLERILKVVKEFADEIVVVDTGSSDSTVEIAKKFTDKVFDFPWQDDFSKARNFAFSKGSCDYLMWLDADDFIFPKDVEKIKKLKASEKNFDVAFFKYVTGYDEKFKPTFIFERERIVKNDGTFFWQEPVHEVIVPHGIALRLDIKVYHMKEERVRPKRNLEIYEKNLNNLSPRATFYYARELYYNHFYDRAIAEFSKFLNMQGAWVENKIEACLNMSYCFLNLGDTESALKILFQSFAYDLPRAEILCQIGNVYFNSDYQKAIYYFSLALKCKMDVGSGAFVLPLYYDFYPSIELCVLYYRLGDYKKSYKFHKCTKRLQPNHPSVIHNEKLFNDLKSQNLI